MLPGRIDDRVVKRGAYPLPVVIVPDLALCGRWPTHLPGENRYVTSVAVSQPNDARAAVGAGASPGSEPRCRSAPGTAATGSSSHGFLSRRYVVEVVNA